MSEFLPWSSIRFIIEPFLTGPFVVSRFLAVPASLNSFLLSSLSPNTKVSSLSESDAAGVRGM
jgi:hypothetical protein